MMEEITMREALAATREILHGALVKAVMMGLGELGQDIAAAANNLTACLESMDKAENREETENAES